MERQIFGDASGQDPAIILAMCQAHATGATTFNAEGEAKKAIIREEVSRSQ